MTRFFTLLLITALMASCGGTDSTEVVTTDAVDAPISEKKASAVYNVDASASTVKWEGSKVVGGSHVGTIPVTDGQIMISEAKVVGGKFAMDLRKMTNTDLPADKGQDLLDHLQSEDFFQTEKYPMAEFAITSVQPATGKAGITHEVTGNLTLRGVTKSVTIPTNVSLEGDVLKATSPPFTIDRMKWGIEYGNGSIADLAKDNVISDNVGLELMLVARK